MHRADSFSVFAGAAAPDSAVAAAVPRKRGWLRRMRGLLRARWFSIDHRSLGLFRIAFGLCLIGNLYDHAAGGNLVAFFTNDGVLSNHLALFAPIQQRPWSLLFAFSRPGEVVVAFAAILAVYVCYTLGWKTRLMQVLVIVCFLSLVNRNLLLQDGASFTCTILAVWTAFLPLGARFSLDRRLHAARDQRTLAAETTARVHVSFVCFALLIQLAVIYGFNAAHKNGETWRTGTAVHYVLWLLSRNTALAGFLRLHEPGWLSPVLTYATLVFEWSAPFLALSPIFQRSCRRILIIGMWLLHLGIASLMSLGPFSYAMICYSLLLLRPEDWDSLKTWSPARRARRLARHAFHGLAVRLPVTAAALAYRLRARLDGYLVEGDSGGWRWLPPRVSPRRANWRRGRVLLRECAAGILFVAMAAELTLANPVVPEKWRWTSRPTWMAETLHYLRIYQTWGMFSADVPTNDGGIVVDATLVDGTRLDPLTGTEPDLDAPMHGPYGLDHDWSEYMFYYSWERHRTFRAGLRDYLLTRHHAQISAPEKQIRSLVIYWVTADSPPPGETAPRNVKREVMISYPDNL